MIFIWLCTQPIYGSKPSTAPPQPPSSAPRNVKVTLLQIYGSIIWELLFLKILPVVNALWSLDNFHCYWRMSTGCFVTAEYERGGTWRYNKRDHSTFGEETRIISKTQGGVSQARGDVWSPVFLRWTNLNCCFSGSAREKTSSTTGWLCWFCKPSQSGDLLC